MDDLMDHVGRLRDQDMGERVYVVVARRKGRSGKQ